MVMKRKTVLDKPSGWPAPKQSDFDSTQDYINALRLHEEGPQERDYGSKQDFINAGGVPKPRRDLAAEALAAQQEKDKAALAALEPLAVPLAAPLENSAEVERARRRALISAGLRSGRLSTILKDKSY